MGVCSNVSEYAMSVIISKKGEKKPVNEPDIFFFLLKLIGHESSWSDRKADMVSKKDSLLISVSFSSSRINLSFINTVQSSYSICAIGITFSELLISLEV